MPAFLLGELLIIWFALDLHWFSFEAPQSSSVWGILSDPRALVLPVFSLAVLTIAGLSRYMRSSMMEALTEDYIRTARAKGAGPRRVLYRHALRNALIPIITLLGLTLPAIVGGAIIIETVFSPRNGPVDAGRTNNDVPLLSNHVRRGSPPWSVPAGGRPLRCRPRVVCVGALATGRAADAATRKARGNPAVGFSRSCRVFAEKSRDVGR
jgi:hypothetical protein